MARGKNPRKWSIVQATSNRNPRATRSRVPMRLIGGCAPTVMPMVMRSGAGIAAGG